jgi:hypothetical protein
MLEFERIQNPKLNNPVVGKILTIQGLEIVQFRSKQRYQIH